MKGTIKILGMCVILLMSSIPVRTAAQQQTASIGTPWTWENGTIVPQTPQRPAGQQSVIGLTAAPMEVVRVAFVGLGMRGPEAVSRWTNIPGTQIVALCDYEESRAVAC